MPDPVKMAFGRQVVSLPLSDILPMRRTGRAGRPAIDASGADADEEQAVESGIAALQCSVGGVRINEHAISLQHCRDRN